jgi:hypothetical protein
MAELTSILNEYQRGTISKDALLELIKSQIEQNPSQADYNLIFKHFKQFEILFFSTNDLAFLSFFNKMIKIHNNMKHALLGENIDQFNCKVDYSKPGQIHFDFNQMETYSEKFHYLIHTVHDIRDLSSIFTERGIRLKGNSNKDYYGVSLVWFGTSNEKEKSKNSSRYGSISFKINIDKVLAKGRNYFAMGTRKYTRERSHSILITNREQIRIQTQLKKTNKITKEENSSEFEHDFPRIPNIEANELCKKVNNEWYLNDGLDLDDSSGDWDHPEYCLEANEESGEDHYVYFDFEDFKIFFLEHDYCVKEFKNCNKVKTSRDAMEKFIELIEPEHFFRLRNCFDKETLQELLELQNQLKKIRLIIDLKLCL